MRKHLRTTNIAVMSMLCLLRERSWNISLPESVQTRGWVSQWGPNTVERLQIARPKIEQLHD